MFRRHPILTLLSLLGVAGLLSVAYFLATFDLNSYREELQSRLSKTLAQPVQLGEAHLSFHPGPAFDFSVIFIGDAGEPLLQADRLSLQTRLLPLLIGKLSFHKIVLHRPQAHLTLDPATGQTPAPPRPAMLLHQLLGTVRVHSLRIDQGTVQLRDLRQPDKPFVIQLADIDLRAQNIYSRDKGRLQLSGRVAGQPDSRLHVAGRLSFPTDLNRWQQSWLDLTAALQDIDPDGLCGHFADRAGCAGSSGRLDLKLTLKGSPQNGLAFVTNVRGKDLLLRLPEHDANPLPLQKARFAGRWTATEQLNRLDDLALELNDLQLTGHLSLQSDDADPWLEGGLSTPELPLVDIAKLLPGARSPFSHLLPEPPSAGTLQLAYSRFAGPLSQFRRQALHQAIEEATLYLRDARFRFAQGPLFSGVSATATWKQQQLSVTDGTALVLESPLQFSALIKQPFQPEAAATLGAGWVLPGHNLAQLYDAPWLQSVAAEGPIPLSFNMNGPVADLQWTLQADMQACNLNYRERLTKPAGMPGGINLQGELSPEALRLSGGNLRLGPLQLSLVGQYARNEARDFSLQMALAETDLGQIQTLAPDLEKFQLQGRLAGNYRLQGAGGALRDGGGKLQASGVGVHFPAVVKGDLQNLHGPIELHPDRIQWQPLSGLLGNSPVAVGGRISNWSKPRIELNITAKQLRANELIFPSPQSRLHQLDGSLVISGNRVEFDNVRVTLDGGTKVVVNGYHQGGAQPETILTAASKKANVDQVVALWQGPKKARQPSTEKRYKVVVMAEVAQGTYDQLDFQQATATITATPGLVDISPVRFATGGGHGLTQIAVQKGSEGQQNLSVSGHIEGVEAGSLKYGRIIDKKGLLSGTANGDFSLQGELGDEFLKTVDGDFHLAIKEGVLHKFTFLAKVFSLLNISQIFTLKLPDMVEEGMPFTELQGNFALRDGILSTEDLFVTSNAMNLSLVGQVDLPGEELDLVLGIKPLRTVDKLITRIPIAGWLLTGEDKALITAHFEIKGPSRAPKVQAIPVTSISGKVLGIFQRVLGLPGKLITDPGEVITGKPSEPAPQAP